MCLSRVTVRVQRGRSRCHPEPEGAAVELGRVQGTRAAGSLAQADVNIITFATSSPNNVTVVVPRQLPWADHEH